VDKALTPTGKRLTVRARLPEGGVSECIRDTLDDPFYYWYCYGVSYLTIAR
jgi:hypothetical protein